jgi:hypothetical protein
MNELFRSRVSLLYHWRKRAMNELGQIDIQT